MDSLLRRPWPARPAPPAAAVDGAVTALIAVTALTAFSELASMPGLPRWAAVVIAALGVLPAGWRRRWPRAVLTVTATAWAVAAALSPSPVPALAVAFVMYLIPLRLTGRDALGALAGTLALLTAGLAVFAVVRHGVYRPGGTGDAAVLLAANGLLVTVAWLIGYAVRQQRAYQAGQREQAEERARARRAEERRAGYEERLRIAREVHDVVAHTMSVIAVQAGVAAYVGRSKPGEAVRALSSIEETSRGALREMRALLAVLRAGDAVTGEAAAGPPDAGLSPAPGLDDLGALAARTAEAGVTVEVDVRGEPRRLPAGLDLAAYRVIQESVTNVIKHAAVGRCAVAVAYQPDSLVLTITNDGPGPGRPGGDGRQSPGHGIAGMRERVTMYGGQFAAGPLPGHGFRVIAAGEALLAPRVTRRLIAEFTSRPGSGPGPRRPAAALAEVTAREREVLTLIGLGLSNTEIAARLNVSMSTAKTHVGRLLMKLGARDRAQLVITAYDAGLVGPEAG